MSAMNLRLGCIFWLYNNGVCRGCQQDLSEEKQINAYAMQMKIDIHCHSTASDGSLTPRELVLRAHNLQVKLLALTDHDTLAGLEQARQAVAELGNDTVFQLVSGIELSCRWHSFEIHILGWHFDANHAALSTLVEQQSQARRERSAQIINKLIEHGVAPDHLASVQARHAHAEQLVTRKHLAEALVEHGYVNSMDAAFERYLGKGQCAYTQPQWCSIEQAVEAITQAGGVAAIAHPLAYGLSNKWLKRLVQDFVDVGGQALEVSTGQQAPHQRQFLASLANQHALLASAGSDFHNPGRWRELGHNIALPAECTAVWHDWPEVRELQQARRA